MFSNVRMSLRVALLAAAVFALPDHVAGQSADRAAKACSAGLAGWLKQHLGDPDLVVLDMRSAIDGGGREAYARRISPARCTATTTRPAGASRATACRSMLPTVAELEKLIGETGIDEDSHVVVVPAGVSATDFGAAARVYWTLKVAGHPAVSILDGGFAAWRPTGIPGREPATIVPSPQIFTANSTSAARRELGEVEQAVQTSTRRWSMRGRRASSPARRRRRRPRPTVTFPARSTSTARSSTIRRPTGCGPRTQLAAIAAKLPAGPVVAYCNTGHWAATDWFVLSEVLGRPDVKLYAGSMVEWSADAKSPGRSLAHRLGRSEEGAGARLVTSRRSASVTAISASGSAMTRRPAPSRR